MVAVGEGVKVGGGEGGNGAPSAGAEQAIRAKKLSRLKRSANRLLPQWKRVGRWTKRHSSTSFCRRLADFNHITSFRSN